MDPLSEPAPDAPATPRPPARPGGPADRLVTVVARVQAPLGLLLTAAGFAAVFFGWLEASGTADVRIELQDLISGGVGGLGMLVVGGVLLQAALADRSAARTERALTELADRLSEPAAGRLPRTTLAGTEREALSGRSRVLATHASFHQSGCDLLQGRPAAEISDTTVASARRRGLSACRICLPAGAGDRA